MYYTEQQQQDGEEPGTRGGAGTGLYAALSHLNQVKRTGPGLMSQWLPVIRQEAEEAKENSEPLKENMEGED